MAIQPFAMQGQVANIMLPSEAIQGAAQAKAAQNRNAMFEMEVKDKQNLDQAYRESGGDINAMMKNPNLGFEAGTRLQEISSENVKAQNAAKIGQLDFMLKGAEYSAQLAGSAQNQADWDRVRQHAIDTLGAQAAETFPAEFSESARNQVLQGAMSFKDKLDMQRADLQMQREDRMANQQDRMYQLAVGREGRLAAGGGGDSGGKPKNQIIYDAQGQGYVIDVNDPSLTPRPIGMGGAQAEQGADGSVFKKAVTTPQASEDERKAAGWLAQARLASQQMKESMAADPTVSNKPFSESLAERLPFVKEEDINVQRSPQRQRFTAAASSFSEAALRAATGAGINEMEAKQKIAELTPVYGESDASIADKMARQEMYIQSLEQRAGRAAPKNPAPTGKTMSMQQLQRAAADKFGGDLNAARQAAQQHGYSINE